MARKPYTINRLKQLDDNDRVVICLYAYGMFVDDTFTGTTDGSINGNKRGYITKKDIIDNITNPDWLYSKVFKEEYQEVDGQKTLVLRAEI